MVSKGRQDGSNAPSMNVTDEKKQLRQALTAVRDHLDPKVRAAAADRMLDHLRGWPERW